MLKKLRDIEVLYLSCIADIGWVLLWLFQLIVRPG